MNLEGLDLFKTQVSDLSPLAGLTKLKGMSIVDSPVRDLTHLNGLPNLKLLGMFETNVSAEEVDRLHRALPNCQIEYRRRQD